MASVPSGVTVIREADGRFYAWFVVEVADTALPPVTADVGVDLGLDRLAVTSAGRIVDGPRHLRRRVRALAWAQRGCLGRCVARYVVSNRA